MKSKEDLIFKLGEIAADLSAITALDDLKKTVEKIVNSIVDVQYWGMYFYDESSNSFKMLSAKGFTLEELREAERTAIDRHPGWVFKSQKKLYIKDTLTDKSGKSTDSKRNFEVRSRLWLPILCNGKSIGAFGFASIYPNYFNEEHISTLSFVCHLSGVVYHNIELLELKKEQTLELIKANKNLIEINDSLDSFAYKITHDLRSPATNVKGLINVFNFILKDAENNEFNDILNKLDLSVDILLEKLDAFVELLKLESINQNKKEKFNLAPIMTDIISQLSSDIENSGGRIEFSQENFNFHIYSIKEYIKSIFFNLVQNAIKYKSDNRKLVIKLKTKLHNDHIEINISDNGEGINEKYYASLFTMFSRFSRNTKVSGSGIGLYIVKKQIDKLKGKISIESKVDVGTNFSILLPIIE